MVVTSFDSDSAQAFTKAQLYFNTLPVKNDLYIKAHFKILINSITRLKTVGLPLTESVEIIEKLIETLENPRINCYTSLW